MTASPPGRGPWTRWEWLRGIAAYTVALPAGAISMAAVLYLAGHMIWQPPIQFVGIVAFGSAGLGSTLIPVGIPQSPWKIPRSWARFGHATYAALFGFILGLGVLTTVASVGYYVLLAWGLAAASWREVLTVFAAFGVARATPLLVIALIARRNREYPIRVLERFKTLAVLFYSVEIMLLATLGILLIATPSL